MQLTGKTALVTGASRGIGREIAVAFGRHGARLALVSRSRQDLDETRRLIGGQNASVFRADLRSEEEINQLGESVHASLGEVDILVNAAGVWHDAAGKYQGPLLPDTPAGQIREVVEVGLHASFLLARLFVPDMIHRGGGKILQISCGFAGPHEAVGWLHYYVTNKAIEAFTEGLAAELRPHSIQVNCMAPWFVATEAAVRFYPAQSQTALDPADVARLAVFLASSDADHISGQVIGIRSKLDFG